MGSAPQQGQEAMSRRRFVIGAVAGLALAAGAGRPAWAAVGLEQLPRPTGSLTYRWRDDPYARGSYSALPPGSPASVRRTLADAVLGSRIVLAGEYCSTRYPATTTGAYESGIHAAGVLLRAAEPRSVIVVGAGMAGAAAASALAADGVDVVVLEARDRIGGRIRSDDAWGTPVELGAGWIHGMTGNPITALARAAGLGLHITDYDDAIVRDTMTGRTSPDGARAQDQLGRLVSRLEEQWPPVGLSVQDWLAREGWQSNRFRQWAAAVEITQEFGVDPRDLGVRATEEGADMRGPDALVSGGYSRIPERLLEGIDVRLSRPVSSIVTSGSAARVSLASGEVLSADAVVCAVPLAVLQAGEPGIEPMTPSVSRALGALRTGDLQKVVLRYGQRWWPDASVIGVVGGGVPGAPAGSAPSLRWTEFYDITAVLGFPALAGFSGGLAARALPAGPDTAAHEAQRVLARAFAR